MAYNKPQANAPAIKLPPTIGFSMAAAPVLGDGVAPELVFVACSSILPISWALTPVPLTHWSSARS